MKQVFQTWVGLLDCKKAIHLYYHALKTILHFTWSWDSYDCQNYYWIAKIIFRIIFRIIKQGDTKNRTKQCFYKIYGQIFDPFHSHFLQIYAVTQVTHTYTHTHIYIYIHICVCIYMCIYIYIYISKYFTEKLMFFTFYVYIYI